MYSSFNPNHNTFWGQLHVLVFTGLHLEWTVKLLEWMRVATAQGEEDSGVVGLPVVEAGSWD